MTDRTFTFMGTAAGCGVPSFFCDCPACEEARADSSLARGDCGVMVRSAGDSTHASSTIMIDTPPDARHQLLREGIKSVDAILFTHCHYDHIGGLGEYEYLVSLKRGGERLPIYGTEEALSGIMTEFHYMDYCLEPHILEPFQPIELGGVKYTPLPVTHAPGTVGYMIETEDTRLFYASDTGPLPSKTADIVKGCDILAMDATFWKRNWNADVHHSIQECIAEGLELDAGKIYLTHMCMHYDEPITYAELVEYLTQYDGRVIAALDGMTLDI